MGRGCLSVSQGLTLMPVTGQGFGGDNSLDPVLNTPRAPGCLGAQTPATPSPLIEKQ